MPLAPGTRADIWAFGGVLYEMLTGRRPFAWIKEFSRPRSTVMLVQNWFEELKVAGGQ